MPAINISIMEGRDENKKRLLIEKVTDAVVESLEVRRENVRIYIWEIKKENYGRGGSMIHVEKEKGAGPGVTDKDTL